jgi:OOP family OmpA-OmpF porin
MRRFLMSAGVVCAVAAGAHSAKAQQAGFALNRFEPSERGSEWFAQDTLDFRGHLRPFLGVVGDYGHKPLVAYDQNGDERAAIVRHQLFAHVGASIVLAHRIRFGLSVPIAAWQDGTASTVSGVAYSPADRTTIGDVRLGGDVRLLGQYGDPFVAAFGVQVFLPTGDRNQWTGDGKVRVVPRLQIAGDIGLFAYAARLGAAYRARSEDFAGSKIGSEFMFGASAGVRVADRKLLIGPEIFGTTVFEKAFERKTTPLELLFGAHYTMGDVRIGGGVGPGLTRGFGSPELRALVSVEYVPAYVEAKKVEPGPGDRDHDGILDPTDACPDEAGIASSDPKKHGCPVRDDDKDGIENDKDACPQIAGAANADPKKNGCPPDKDEDSILDSDDACPEVKGVKSDDPKKNGCPPDKDEDSILDADDACPDVKGVKSDDPKKNGCPPDRDNDTIVDAEDACPDAPGPKNEDPKKNGCPQVAIVGSTIMILEQVKFKTNSAEILKESDDLLTNVAKIINEHSELKKIKVEGHTDNKGAPAYNKTLSKNRAASVVKWLTTKGKVNAKRLVSEGFGQENPIDSNDTDAGRQNNRRVEFKILETDKPVAVEPEQPKAAPAPAPAPKK